MRYKTLPVVANLLIRIIIRKKPTADVLKSCLCFTIISFIDKNNVLFSHISCFSRKQADASACSSALEKPLTLHITEFIAKFDE